MYLHPSVFLDISLDDFLDHLLKFFPTHPATLLSILFSPIKGKTLAQGLILKVRLPGILQGLKLRGTSRCYLLYMLSIKDKKTRFFLVADVLALVLVGYVVSILWRVSCTEVEQFGASKLIPMPSKNIAGRGPCGPETYFSPSYRFVRGDHEVVVWTDKINCFQHVYGSALVASELGELPAHLLFCANEYAEYLFDHDGVSEEDLLDRRKDLAHNKVGRELGLRREVTALNGSAREERLKALVLAEMETANRVYLSYLDPRVKELPDEAAQGCPFLPGSNLFNLFK